jgi:hypothetical protein
MDDVHLGAARLVPRRLIRLVATLLALSAAVSWAAEPFSFSKDAERDRVDEDAQARKVAELVSVPCRQGLKNKKILLLIAERTEGDFDAAQERYGPHLRAIDSRLRALGLQTYTPEQIRAQVAQAEIDAYFRNDPDAALAASRRLAADFVLRGDIATRIGTNRVLDIDEVSVNFDLRLTNAATGRLLSEVGAKSESFSGADVLGTALTLVKAQADPLVAQIYNDFCRRAVPKS